jgi:hypothetical protein
MELCNKYETADAEMPDQQRREGDLRYIINIRTEQRQAQAEPRPMTHHGACLAWPAETPS